MNKNIYYLAFFAMLSAWMVFGQMSHAQNFDKGFPVKVSAPYKVIDAGEKQYFSYENHVLAVKAGRGVVNLQLFDGAKLTETNREEYDDFEKEFSFEDLIQMNDKVYLFYSVWDKPNGNEQLFSRQIDITTGKFTEKGKLIIKTNEKLTGSAIATIGFWSAGVKDKFGFVKSFDENKLLINYRFKPQERDDSKSKDKIGMHVFDVNLNEEWSNIVTMPYTEQEMDNWDYAIDSDGNSYIVAKVFSEPKKGKRGPSSMDDSKYHVEILRFSNGSETVEKSKVNIGEKLITDIKMFEGTEGNIVCAGYYSDRRKTHGVDGVFTFKVKQQGEIYDVNEYEIPVSVINKFMNPRAQARLKKKDSKKDNVGFSHLKLRNMAIGTDGSIMLSGEQYYVVRRTDSQGRTTYTYYYNDILATMIGPDGELSYMTKLAKRQMSRGGSSMGLGISFGPSGTADLGFRYLNIDDGHYYYFLDNVKNMDLAENENPAYHTGGAGGYLTAYRIDEKSGKVTKHSILDTRKVKNFAISQFSTNRMVSFQDQSLIFEAYKKKKEDVLIKVSVD